MEHSKENALRMFAESLMANPPMNTQFGFDGLNGLLAHDRQPQGLLGIMSELHPGRYDNPAGTFAEIIQPQFNLRPKVNPMRGDYGFRATMKW